MIFKWAISRRSMDEDQRFGSGVNLGWSSLTRDASTRSPLWMTQWLRGISGIVETPDGDLWLNAISGIFHIRKAEISEALKDSAYRVKGEHFGRREGLSGVASQAASVSNRHRGHRWATVVRVAQRSGVARSSSLL